MPARSSLLTFTQDFAQLDPATPSPLVAPHLFATSLNTPSPSPECQILPFHYRFSLHAPSFSESSRPEPPSLLTFGTTVSGQPPNHKSAIEFLKQPVPILNFSSLSEDMILSWELDLKCRWKFSLLASKKREEEKNKIK